MLWSDTFALQTLWVNSGWREEKWLLAVSFRHVPSGWMVPFLFPPSPSLFSPPQILMHVALWLVAFRLREIAATTVESLECRTHGAVSRQGCHCPWNYSSNWTNTDTVRGGRPNTPSFEQSMQLGDRIGEGEIGSKMMQTSSKNHQNGYALLEQDWQHGYFRVKCVSSAHPVVCCCFCCLYS